MRKPPYPSHYQVNTRVRLSDPRSECGDIWTGCRRAPDLRISWMIAWRDEIKRQQNPFVPSSAFSWRVSRDRLGAALHPSIRSPKEGLLLGANGCAIRFGLGASARARLPAFSFFVGREDFEKGSRKHESSKARKRRPSFPFRVFSLSCFRDFHLVAAIGRPELGRCL